MKVIVIGPAYPFRGGIADTNESFCRALIAQGHDASIVTFTLQYPGFLFPGKTQLSIDPKPDLDITQSINSIGPLSWLKTAKQINDAKPDMVIVRYWLPFMAMSLGSIGRLLDKSIKKIAMCDNIIPHEKRAGDVALTKYFEKAFDGFITLSSTVLEELESFTMKPTAYFPHPINDNLGVKMRKADARQKLGLAEGNYLLFFGLIRKYKGLDLLLQALAHPLLKKHDVKLIVAGEFYDDPAEYHQLIEKLGLTDKVIIKDEYIATSDLATYFSAADMVAQTYRSASQSGVSQMAFNFDCPVLVTNVGGLSEFIKPHVGYVTEKSPESIAAGIADLYENDKYEQLSVAVAEEKKKYSWRTFADRVVELSEKL